LGLSEKEVMVSQTKEGQMVKIEQMLLARPRAMLPISKRTMEAKVKSISSKKVQESVSEKVGGEDTLTEPKAEQLEVKLPVIRLLVIRLPIVWLPMVRQPLVKLPGVKLPVTKLPVTKLPVAKHQKSQSRAAEPLENAKAQRIEQLEAGPIKVFQNTVNQAIVNLTLEQRQKERPLFFRERKLPDLEVTTW